MRSSGRIFLLPLHPNYVAVRTAEGISQPAYNLMGQKVSVSQRGLLIRNGRKYLNK